MMKEGCDTIVDIEKISKMGLIEVLPSLINIVNIRKKIINLCKKKNLTYLLVLMHLLLI